VSEANKIVNENLKKFEEYNNYVVQGSKMVVDKKDGKQYRIAVNLQIFSDEQGKVIMIREV